MTKLISTLPAYQEALKKQWLEPLLEQLTLEENRVVLDLCVFNRPICEDHLLQLFPNSGVEKVLLRLRDNFILEVSDAGVHMHPLLREFAFSTLQPDAQKRKHLWAADSYLREQQLDESTESLDPKEVDALVGGWYHCIKAADITRATKIVWKLRTTLINQGQYEHMYRLLDSTSAGDEFRDLFAIQKARILHIWNRSDEAISLLSHIIVNSDDNRKREAVLVLARIYTETENAHGAITLLHKHWQPLFAHLKSSTQSTRLLERMVDAQLAAGDVDDAFRVAERMFVLGQDRENSIQSATAAFHLARCLKQKREFMEALEYSKRSAELYKRVGRVRDSARAEFLTSRTYRELGQTDLAILSAEAAMADFTRIGDKNNKFECREFLRTLKPIDNASTGS